MEGGADSAHAGRGFSSYFFIFRRLTQVNGFHHWPAMDWVPIIGERAFFTQLGF
jgi:hypothetical protein